MRKKIAVALSFNKHVKFSFNIMFTFSFNMHSLFKRPNVQLKFTTIEIRLQLHFHPAATHLKKK